LFLGIALVLVAWSLSWFGPARLGAHTFFPLWLGYILTVDGLVAARSGASLWTRNPAAFVTLFFISAPLWWLYEAANVRLQNWHYHLPHDYGWLHYRAESTLAFSTVLPAVFETTELLMTTRLGKRAGTWRRFSLSPERLHRISVLGALMLVLSMLVPRYFFPLVWIGGFLLIDPVNARRSRQSLLRSASQGHWRPTVVLAVAGPFCGFFWEMWNIRAMPKWTYEIPFFDWMHLFEMPILGYGGYVPFAFGLYAAYHLFTALLPERSIARLTIDERGTDSRETTES
jgi:hypothetical protein